jgi:hypothetical protein
MNTLTKEQLVKALTAYYAHALAGPDEFYEAESPEQSAIDATEYIFEIAAQQIQGA